MTKDQEIALLERTTASFPEDSYLRLYFDTPDVRSEIIFCIRSDFGAPDLQGLRRVIEEEKAGRSLVQKEIAELRASKARMQEELEELQREAASQRRTIQKAKALDETLDDAIGRISSNSESLAQAAQRIHSTLINHAAI